ncbi:hypothetical protein MKW92_014259 [Papaver armeniacum]|nr:hypothetical protein MKW92_014259 [Papaver armeniacum]
MLTQLRKRRRIDDEPEDKKEERRIAKQAELGVWLKKKVERRVLGVKYIDSHKEEVKPPKPWLKNVTPFEVGKRRPVTSPLKLRMETKERVISLTDVLIILPKLEEGQGGESIAAGTLETHVNGFIYTASNYRKHFYFHDIKKSFFRLGDKKMPPLLHFQLHVPFMKGIENTKDIEFHLVQCPLRQKQLIEEEKQISWDGGHNERLKNFVDKVYLRWSSLHHSPCLFHELEKNYEFYGVFSSKASAFVLTSHDLIVLLKTPFTVFPLRDVDFVNLALLRSGEIDMTVIFQDYSKEDSVLEINSIPLKALASIKDCLNDGYVKYYVNTKELEWKAILKDITDFPQKFIENGGWDYFELEDSKTLANYCKFAEDEPWMNWVM